MKNVLLSAILVSNCVIAQASFVALPSQFQERFVTTHDNINLYSIYRPAETFNANQPTVLWLHGMGKHSRRFADGMNYLAQRGYASLSFDIRGHGRSEGERGHFEHVDQLYDDIEAVIADYKQQIQGPLFVVAHSAGGALLTRYLQKRSDRNPFAAVILSAPGIAVNCDTFPWWKQTLVKLVSKIAPRYQINVISKKPRPITHNLEIIKLDKLDPFVVRSVSAQFLATILHEAVLAQQEAHKIQCPVHMFLAGEDCLVDNAKLIEFYQNLTTHDKSIRVFETMYHSLFQEVEQQLAFEAVVEIFDRYLIVPVV